MNAVVLGALRGECDPRCLGDSFPIAIQKIEHRAEDRDATRREDRGIPGRIEITAVGVLYLSR